MIVVTFIVHYVAQIECILILYHKIGEDNDDVIWDGKIEFNNGCPPDRVNRLVLELYTK